MTALENQDLRKSTNKKLLTYFFVTIIALSLSAICYDKTRTISAEEAHHKMVISQFDPYDGSHRNLEAYVKTKLRDPKSYEHIQTKFVDHKDHLVVRMHYRARNGFGGMGIGYAKANVNMNGEITSIQMKSK